MKNVLITIPAFREHENISILCKKILSISSKKYNYYILIIDDSDDLKTLTVLKNTFNLKALNSARNTFFNKKITVKKRKKKSGRGSAILMGMKIFLNKSKKKFNIFVEMDADLSHSTSELIRNLKFFSLNKADLLISSRYLHKSKILNWPKSRKIFSSLSNKLARFILNIPISDYTNGYRIYSKRAVLNTTKNCGKIGDGFIILSEILVNLYYKKFKILEIDSIFRNRIRGESSVTLNEVLRSFIGLIKLYFLKKSLY